MNLRRPSPLAAMLLVGLLAVIVAYCAGCASLKQPNGSLDVPKLLQWVQWGIDPACSSDVLPPTVCTFARDTINIATTVAVKDGDPSQKRAAVKQILVDAGKPQPQLPDWWQWLTDVL